MIQNYDDFVKTLLATGFSMGSANSEGIYSILPWNWNEPPPYETPVRWYTGDPITDPCEWINRILTERNDITYGKLFCKKSGFLTKEWFPYFFAVRRGDTTFEEAYEGGTISHAAKRIYKVVSSHETILVEEIKQAGKFSREEKSAFDKALTELQMSFYISNCGRRYKVSKKGEEYGMASTMFCMTERFWGEDFLAKAAVIEPEAAKKKITAHILKINPNAQAKKINKFIMN